MKDKKIAIVTGGTRGIGRAISIGLQEDGYFVIANYSSNSEKAKEFEKETGIVTACWDVSDFAECQKNILNIQEKFDGSIVALVNNAGISKDAMLHKLDPDNWYNVLNTNLNSCYNMSRAELIICVTKNMAELLV